jgi:hypothetical protein
MVKPIGTTSRELVITACIPLPEGAFVAAPVLTAAKEAYDKFEEMLKATVPAIDFKLEHEIVNRRAAPATPRKKKGEAPQQAAA